MKDDFSTVVFYNTFEKGRIVQKNIEENKKKEAVLTENEILEVKNLVNKAS